MKKTVEIRLNELQENLNGLLGKISSKAKEHDDAVKSGDFATASDALEIASKTARDANKIALEIQKVLFTEGDYKEGVIPFTELALNGSRYAVISVKEEKDAEGIPVLRVKHRYKFFNPLVTSKNQWSKLCADRSGFFIAEAFYVLLAKDIATTVSEISAAEFKENFGQYIKVHHYKNEDGVVVPKLDVSNSKILSALRVVISSLVGEEIGKKVISADARLFTAGYSKSVTEYDEETKKTRGKVIVFKMEKMMELLVTIINRIVDDSKYAVEIKSARIPKKKEG